MSDVHDHCAEATKFNAVRALHRPVARQYPRTVAYCEGCDLGPYAEDLPDWPCSTAEIVYTTAEIAAVRARETGASA